MKGFFKATYYIKVDNFFEKRAKKKGEREKIKISGVRVGNGVQLKSFV